MNLRTAGGWLFLVHLQITTASDIDKQWKSGISIQSIAIASQVPLVPASFLQTSPGTHP